MEQLLPPAAGFLLCHPCLLQLARHLAQQRWRLWLQTSANLQNPLEWSQAVALGCLVATSQVWGWQLKKVGGWDEVGFPADLCPLQMKSFMLASTSTSWARMQPSSAPWASRRP